MASSLRTSRAAIIGALLFGLAFVALALNESRKGESFDGYGETVTGTIVERHGRGKRARTTVEFTTKDGQQVRGEASGRYGVKGDPIDVTYDPRDPARWRIGTTVPDRTGLVLTITGAVAMLGLAGWLTVNRVRNRAHTAGVGGSSFQ